MQKLISIGPDEITFVGSEDHYIIDNISQTTLNEDISEAALIVFTVLWLNQQCALC